MTKPSPKELYWHEKSRRIQSQRKVVRSVLTLPMAQWGRNFVQVLAGKAVQGRAFLDPEQALQAWRDCCAIAAEGQIGKFIDLHIQCWILSDA